MITSLGAQWTTADLTGDGQFVDMGSGVIYVVSNSLVNNTFKVYKSTDNGGTFSTAGTYTFPAATAQFDPAISKAGTALHIVGTQTNQSDNSLTDLVLFKFETSTDTLGSPTTLVTGTRVHSDYDISTLSNGTHIIVTSVIDLVNPDLPGYSMVAIHADTDNSVLSVDVLGASSSVRAGDVYGAITLTTDGTSVELYYTSHPKRVTFGSVPQQLLLRTRNGAGVWSAATVLQDYISHYVDDKLTVVPLTGTDRIIAHLYYKQVKNRLSTVLVLGKRDGGVWSWVYYPGTGTWTYMEPTLSVDTAQNIRIAYLVGDANLNLGGLLRVSDVDFATLKYTARPGHYNQLSFRWLRGSKGYVDTATSKWAIIGEKPVVVSNVITGYEPLYVSEYNLPPVVSLVILDDPNPPIDPPNANILRGVTLHLDAGGTTDPDYDTLEYTWSLSGAPVGVVLVPVPGHPERQDVYVPKTVGPTQQLFDVIVSVQDTTVNGTPINTPVTATAHLTIPLNQAPTITWSPSSTLTVPRNSGIVLQPTIADADLDALTFSWTQTSGPTLTVVGDTTSAYLVVRTNGVNVLGETAQFQVTVSDGINSPVSSTVTLNIVSINLSYLDQRFLSRSIFTTIGGTSPIATRNNPTAQSSWSTVQIGAVSTDFFRVRHSRVALTGHRRQTYIAPRSVTILGQENPGEIYYRKAYLPGNDRGLIIDAVYTEAEQILVLTKIGRLFRYTPTDIGVMNLTDIWQDAIDLIPYLRGGTIKWFTCSVPQNGHRILAFVTTNGVLLTQVNEEDFRLEAVLYLSTYDFNLYGGDDVLFIRFKDVESLRRGQILVGSAAPKTDISVKSDFEYFETVYDLDLRAVLNVWDRTNRINERVETGEMLDSVAAEYTGVLQAPVLSLEEMDTTSFKLLWDQVRPDLVSTYQIHANIMPGVPYSRFGAVPIDPTTPFVCPSTVDTLVSTTFVASLPTLDPSPTYLWSLQGGSIVGPADGPEITVQIANDVDTVLLSCSIVTSLGRHYTAAKTVLVRPGATIQPNWKVTLLAGAPGWGDSINGPLGTNRLAAPGSAVLGNDGFIYISENESMKRLNSANGVLEDYFEPGAYLVNPRFRNGPVAQAKLSAYGHAITKAPNGDLYFTDNSSSIRRIRNGVVETFVGPHFYVSNANYGVSVTLQDIDTGVENTVAWPGPDILAITDGVGSAARFKDPQGLAFDAQGNLWVADNTTIRKVTPDGTVTTAYGHVTETVNPATGHQDGSAADIRFERVQGITVAPDGTIFVCDTSTNALRMIKNGVGSTLLRGANASTLDGVGAHACAAATPSAPTTTTGLYYYALTAVDANDIESAPSSLTPGGNPYLTTSITLPTLPANAVGFRLYALDDLFNTVRRSNVLPGTPSVVSTDTLDWDSHIRNLVGTPMGSGACTSPVSPWLRHNKVLFTDYSEIRSFDLATGVVSTVIGNTYRDTYAAIQQGLGTGAAFNTLFYLTPGPDIDTLLVDDWWAETVLKLQYGSWPVHINPHQSAPWAIQSGVPVECYLKLTDTPHNGDPARAYSYHTQSGRPYYITLTPLDSQYFYLEIVDSAGTVVTPDTTVETKIGNSTEYTTYTLLSPGANDLTLFVACGGGVEGSFRLLVVEGDPGP